MKIWKPFIGFSLIIIYILNSTIFTLLTQSKDYKNTTVVPVTQTNGSGIFHLGQSVKKAGPETIPGESTVKDSQ
jgi:hypothetical protein